MKAGPQNVPFLEAGVMAGPNGELVAIGVLLAQQTCCTVAAPLRAGEIRGLDAAAAGVGSSN